MMHCCKGSVTYNITLCLSVKCGHCCEGDVTYNVPMCLSEVSSTVVRVV